MEFRDSKLYFDESEQELANLPASMPLSEASDAYDELFFQRQDEAEAFWAFLLEIDDFNVRELAIALKLGERLQQFNILADQLGTLLADELISVSIGRKPTQ